MKMFMYAVGVLLSLLAVGCTPQPIDNQSGGNTPVTETKDDATPTQILKTGATYYSIGRVVDCELKQILYYSGNGGIAILDYAQNQSTSELYRKTCNKGE